MQDYTEFLDLTLSDFAYKKEFEADLTAFKNEKKHSMRNREIVLRERGLSDSKVIKDLIISENLDTRHEFIKRMRKTMEEKKEKQRMLLKFLMATAYFMAIGIWFILNCFYNQDWTHSWLIIVGGIIVFAIMLFLMPQKMHFKGRRKLPLTVSLIVSSFLLSILVFLIMLTFHIPRSYIVIPASFTIIALIDSIVPAIVKNKFAIIHSLISIPLLGTSLYITLSLSGVLPWATGWLIIIASFIVDILIFVGTTLKHSKAYECEDGEYDA